MSNNVTVNLHTYTCTYSLTCLLSKFANPENNFTGSPNYFRLLATRPALWYFVRSTCERSLSGVRIRMLCTVRRIIDSASLWKMMMTLSVGSSL